MDNEQEKEALRSHYRALRDDFVSQMPSAERAIAFSRSPTPLRQLFKPGKTVAAYVAKGSEADPSSLLAEASALGCATALPHVTSKTAPMRFLRWNPGDALLPGAFGLQQPGQDNLPCAPDIVLVPLLAFDSRLMRLGQGAAHYDRALGVLANVVAIGIGWSVQMAPAIPADPWDVPLNAVLTEQSWISQ